MSINTPPTNTCQQWQEITAFWWAKIALDGWLVASSGQFEEQRYKECVRQIEGHKARM